MTQFREDVSKEIHRGNGSFAENWTAVADNEEIVSAPGSKKSIFLSNAVISNGDTAGYINFVQYPTNSTSSIISSRLNLAANDSTGINFSQSLQLTPNAALLVDSTTADDFSITCNYYIDQVRGFGYTSGGWTGSDAISSVQENYFASDSSSTVGADLAVAGSLFANLYGGAGASSSTHGYTAGGNVGAFGYNRAQIFKFSFTSTANATNIGDLTTAIRYNCGYYSLMNGYSSGGYSTSVVNQISKYSFASDINSILVGELSVALSGAAGQQSSTHGYTSGGYSTDQVNTISKYSFLSDGTSHLIGDLTVARNHTAGQSSVEKGYTAGGWNDPSYYNTVDAFSYASDGNATDIGDLTVARYGSAGQSSATKGYTSGGTTGSVSKIIDKFSFSANGNSSSVGDLVTACSYCIGQQSN